jgi:pyruvate,orthophosphate dikinase
MLVPAGVLFTRNPANGTNELYGEFLLNAQGEDVVAGIRTPMPISLMKEKMPNIYTELHDTVKMLERHMHDMQVRACFECAGFFTGSAVTGGWDM